MDLLSPGGKLVASWSKPTSSGDQFGLLYGIALDSAGNIYVCDASNHQIDKLSAQGALLARWDTRVDPTRQSFPTLLTLDSAGGIYVSDYYGGWVVKLSPTGSVLAKIGGGKLDEPYGVALDGHGDVYVAEYAGNRVLEFSSAGDVLATWGDGSNGTVSLTHPEAVQVDTQGNVYVTEGEPINLVVKFQPTGKVLATWGGTTDLDFHDPAGLTLLPDGTMYVVEFGGDRIRELSPTGQILATYQ